MSGFLNEGGSFEFYLPPTLEKQLPAMNKIKPGEKHQVKVDCKSWQLLDMRAGWNKAGDQICFNIVAKGLSDNYDHAGETENWLSAENVSTQGHVQRKIASSYAQLLIGVGASSAKDWKDADNMTGKEILDLLHGILSSEGKTTGFFDAQLQFTRRAYEKDGNVIPIQEAQFSFIQRGRKVA